MTTSTAPTNDFKLRNDEKLLIQRLRLAPAYATVTVEKRPSAQNPDGEVNRITVSESFLVRDMIIVESVGKI
jgi:hypothetical protein